MKIQQWSLLQDVYKLLSEIIPEIAVWEFEEQIQEQERTVSRLNEEALADLLMSNTSQCVELVLVEAVATETAWGFNPRRYLPPPWRTNWFPVFSFLS